MGAAEAGVKEMGRPRWLAFLLLSLRHAHEMQVHGPDDHDAMCITRQVDYMDLATLSDRHAGSRFRLGAAGWMSGGAQLGGEGGGQR
ncbi:hypothetical protein K466DRAFT_587459, partial [Polyporus arcularius HHB13444]